MTNNDTKKIPVAIEPLAVYTPTEAAELLRTERRTVYNLIDGGKLPKREVGQGYKLLGEDLLRFMGTATQPYSNQPKNDNSSKVVLGAVENS